MTAGSQSTRIATSIIENIKEGNDVKDNLEQLKLLLSSPEQLNVASNIPVNVIFDCLDSQDEAQITNGCDVLTLVLQTYNSHAVLMKSNVAQPLAKCLKHSHAAVKITAINQIQRHINSEEMAFFLGNNRQVVLSTIECLCDEKTSVGLRATTLLSDLGKCKIGLKALCQPDIAKAAICRTKLSDTNRIRLYQALVEISLTSGEYFHQIEFQGYFRDLVTTIKTEDVLANVAPLEINKVRFWMNEILCSSATSPEEQIVSRPAAHNAQTKIVEYLLTMFSKTRDPLCLTSYMNSYEWNQVPEEYLLKPTLADHGPFVYPLIWGIELRESSNEAQIESLTKHLRKLDMYADGSESKRNTMTCELCQVYFESPQAVALHLKTAVHKTRVKEMKERIGDVTVDDDYRY